MEAEMDIGVDRRPGSPASPVSLHDDERTPLFADGIPVARPTIPDPHGIADSLVRVLESGVLTNGPTVRELEEQLAAYLRVRHCIAVASCTAGLMLVLRGADVAGDVVVPSFTFAATAHAVAWNGLRPVFADIDPETLTLSPAATARAIGVRTAAILATHTFGTPCDVERLQELADERGLHLFFDAAHALGSRRNGHPIGGFGDAEVFSLSPTKILVACEGGVIATNDDRLAERCRVGRDYGNPGDYDCRFVGLNARMSEVHAAVALASLGGIDDRVEERNRLAAAYRDRLAGIPGIRFPTHASGDTSTFKDLTILVDEDAFGLSAGELGRQLALDRIETRRYYAPPVHTMQAYRSLESVNGALPVTNEVATQTLTLPLWNGMTSHQIESIGGAIGLIRERRARGRRGSSEPWRTRP
jgi:dTDP-4-amino-4,6-dideoxygalactose transaminase